MILIPVSHKLISHSVWPFIARLELNKSPCFVLAFDLGSWGYEMRLILVLCN